MTGTDVPPQTQDPDKPPLGQAPTLHHDKVWEDLTKEYIGSWAKTVEQHPERAAALSDFEGTPFSTSFKVLDALMAPGRGFAAATGRLATGVANLVPGVDLPQRDFEADLYGPRGAQVHHLILKDAENDFWYRQTRGAGGFLGEMANLMMGPGSAVIKTGQALTMKAVAPKLVEMMAKGGTSRTVARLAARYGPTSVGFAALGALEGKGLNDRAMGALINAGIGPAFQYLGEMSGGIYRKLTRKQFDNMFAAWAQRKAAGAFSGAVEGAGMGVLEPHMLKEVMWGLASGDTSVLGQAVDGLIQGVIGMGLLRGVRPHAAVPWSRNEPWLFSLSKAADAKVRESKAERWRKYQSESGPMQGPPMPEQQGPPLPKGEAKRTQPRWFVDEALNEPLDALGVLGWRTGRVEDKGVEMVTPGFKGRFWLGRTPEGEQTLVVESALAKSMGFPAKLDAPISGEAVPLALDAILNWTRAQRIDSRRLMSQSMPEIDLGDMRFSGGYRIQYIDGVLKRQKLWEAGPWEDVPAAEVPRYLKVTDPSERQRHPPQVQAALSRFAQWAQAAVGNVDPWREAVAVRALEYLSGARLESDPVAADAVTFLMDPRLEALGGRDPMRALDLFSDVASGAISREAAFKMLAGAKEAQGEVRQEQQQERGRVGELEAPGAEGARAERGPSEVQHPSRADVEGRADRPGRASEPGERPARRAEEPSREVEPPPRLLKPTSGRALYRRAQELGIPGRSKMTPEQLRKAIERAEKGEGGESKSGKDAEAGFLDPSVAVDVARLAGRVAGAVVGGPLGFARRWVYHPMTEPLIAKIAKRGGAKGQEIWQKARDALRYSRLLGGRWARRRSRYLHMVRSPTGKMGAAVRSLNEMVRDGSGYETRFQRVVERREEPRNEQERAIRDGYDEGRLMTGREAERAGMMIRVRDPRTGNPTWIAFTANPGRHRFLRIPTQTLRDIYQTKGEAYDTLVDVLSRWNNLTPEQVRQRLKDVADAMDASPTGEKIPEGKLRRDPTEIARAFERFPTHIEGVSEALLEASPYRAYDRMLDFAAKRVGYVKAFGQDVPVEAGGQGAITEKLVREYTEAGGRERDVQNLMRSLHGLPLDEYVRAAPGSYMYSFARGLRFATALRVSGLLTGAWIPQLFEPFGKAQAFVGLGNLLKAYWSMLPELATAEGRQRLRELYYEMEQQGTITTEVAKWTVDRGRALEDLAQMFREVTNAPFRATNELNDFVVGHAALLFVKQLQAGRGTSFSRLRLELLDFTPEQARELAEGRGTSEQYAEVAQRAVSMTQFATLQGAERSRLANSRIFNFWVKFTQYAQNTLRRTEDVLRKTDLPGKTLELLKSPSDAGAYKNAWDASRMLAQYFGGSAMAGTSSQLLRIWVFAHMTGLAAWWREREEEAEEAGGGVKGAAKAVIGAVGSGLHYSLFSGPADAFFAAADKAVDEPEAMMNPIFEMAQPAVLIRDGVLAAGGLGNQFREKDWPDRALTLLERNVAVATHVKRHLATWGLVNASTVRWGTVRSTYYSAREKIAPIGRGYARDPEGAAFRTALKKAHTLMQSGRHPLGPEVTEQLKRGLLEKKAQGKTDKEAMAAIRDALYNRRMLFDSKGETNLTPEQESRLRKRMGDLWRDLEVHDALLTALAQTIK